MYLFWVCDGSAWESCLLPIRCAHARMRIEQRKRKKKGLSAFIYFSPFFFISLFIFILFFFWRSSNNQQGIYRDKLQNIKVQHTQFFFSQCLSSLLQCLIWLYIYVLWHIDSCISEAFLPFSHSSSLSNWYPCQSPSESIFFLVLFASPSVVGHHFTAEPFSLLFHQLHRFKKKKSIIDIEINSDERFANWNKIPSHKLFCTFF